jgi:ferric-dicitrate binding protein FerR (iron transport regulator)
MEEYKHIGLHIVDYLLNEEGGAPGDPILAEWLTVEDNRIELMKYKKIWEEAQIVLNSEQFDKEQAWKRVDDINRRNIRLHRRRKRLRYLTAAAVLLLPVLILTWQLLAKQQDSETSDLSVELKAAYGQVSKFTLPDGSSVWLNADSRLTYTDAFNKDSRSVELSGEAYFEITKNTRKPFTVKAEEVSVQVLGTVFNIQSYPLEKKIETTLLKGSVRIMHKNIPKGGIFLRPGQQLLFDKSDKSVLVKDVDIAPYTSWKEGKLIFRHTTLKEAFAIIERNFRIKIIVNDKSLEECKIRGHFGLDEKPEDIMEALMETLKFEYERQGDTFIIK